MLERHEPSLLMSLGLLATSFVLFYIAIAGLGDRPMRDLFWLMLALSVLCSAAGHFVRVIGNNERTIILAVLLSAGGVVFLTVGCVLLRVEGYLRGAVLEMLFFPTIALLICGVVVQRYRSSSEVPHR